MGVFLCFVYLCCNYVVTETAIHFGLNLCEYQIRAADLKFLQNPRNVVTGDIWKLGKLLSLHFKLFA